MGKPTHVFYTEQTLQVSPIHVINSVSFELLHNRPKDIYLWSLTIRYI